MDHGLSPLLTSPVPASLQTGLFSSFSSFIRQRAGAVFSIFAMFLTSACVTYVPVEEYTLARTAYTAAKDFDAPRYVPAMWFNVETAFREGQRAYRERRYDEARDQFIDAKSYAEQAENAARLARHQSGEVIP